MFGSFSPIEMKENASNIRQSLNYGNNIYLLTFTLLFAIKTEELVFNDHIIFYRCSSSNFRSRPLSL